MTAKKIFFLTLASVLFLAGCSSAPQDEIDSTTGMAKFFCGAVKPEAEQANSDFWTLARAVSGEEVGGKVPSVQEVMNSMLQINSTASLAAKLSTDPAETWLRELAFGAFEVVRWYGNGSDSTEELIFAVGKWKAAYEKLPKYCQ